MFITYFSAEQLISLLPGLALILTTIFIYRTSKQPCAALVLLFWRA